MTAQLRNLVTKFVPIRSALLAVGASLMMAAYAPQQAGSPPLEPALEARVQNLGKQFRCPTCQGLSIADSPASAARAQLDKVRELVAAGQTDEQIRNYFIERYGEWILLQPKAAGFNWLVWLGPVALVLLGLVVILRQIGRRLPTPTLPRPSTLRQAQGLETGAAQREEDGEADEYLNRVRTEIEQ